MVLALQCGNDVCCIYNGAFCRRGRMSTTIMYVLLSFVPAGIVTAIFEAWRRLNYHARSSSSVQDRLLRPPGETSRRKMERLNDRIDETAIWVVGFPSTLLICYVSSTGTDGMGRPVPGVWIWALAMAAGMFVFLIWKLISLIKERNHWRLRFNGERAVGEQLNQFMCDGCRVFHDFPLAKNSHIDHVVVAPSGIYAVETRAERKGGSSHSQQAHEVVYDGKTLEYPLRAGTRDLLQAREQAATLAKFLSEATKTTRPVQPILTLPGWYVIYRGSGEVMVVNPKMIDTAILTHDAPVLTPEQIQEIARVLDQKCRDVEF